MDTLPRVGELARGGSCCHTGDPLSTGPKDPRPSEPSGITWVQSGTEFLAREPHSPRGGGGAESALALCYVLLLFCVPC